MGKIVDDVKRIITEEFGNSSGEIIVPSDLEDRHFNNGFPVVFYQYEYDDLGEILGTRFIKYERNFFESGVSLGATNLDLRNHDRAVQRLNEYFNFS